MVKSSDVANVGEMGIKSNVVYTSPLAKEAGRDALYRLCFPYSN